MPSPLFPSLSVPHWPAATFVKIKKASPKLCHDRPYEWDRVGLSAAKIYYS